MATKTATVQSGQVSGASHSSFPAYVDLADVGVTTLAEAESIRVYSDSGLTTELAREIVSATEMHVKIPTLTSSTQIWIDYDGVRADYAVGATYGRNAVWSDYAYVSHDAGASDSTGNNTPSGSGGITSGGATGQIGDATTYDGSDDYIDIASSGIIDSSAAFTYSAWFKSTATIGQRVLVSQSSNISITPLAYLDFNYDKIRLDIRDDSGSLLVNRPAGTGYLDGTWKMAHGVRDTSSPYSELYVDASSLNTVTSNGAAGAATYNTVTTGARLTSSVGGPYDGSIDEVRMRQDALSADWITTEYNNQNDNVAFWGTWTTAGGGPTPNNSARRLMMMQM